MTDVTQNLFYWFKGPDHDKVFRRQLENNLTKAFITALDHTNRKLLFGELLKKLRLPFCENVQFSLQRKPPIASKAKTRIILGITGGETKHLPGRSKTKPGRPDAWICGGSWTIIVESKVGPKITTAQLDGHAKAAGWQRGSYRIESLSWEDLHRLGKQALAKVWKKKDKTSHLLLAHWVSYLEYQDMADFEKLETMHFDFPNLPEEERRALVPHMKRMMSGFIRRVSKTRPAKKIQRLYGGGGPWKSGEPDRTSRGTWFNIGNQSSTTKWHATVYLRAEGLSVSLLNSRNGLVRKLCNSGHQTFRDIIDIAARRKNLRICCRRAWYRNPKSSYKGQDIDRIDDALLIVPSAVARHSRESCAKMLKTMLQELRKSKNWRTELVIEEQIPRKRVIQASADAQVKMLGPPLETLHRILILLMKG